MIYLSIKCIFSGEARTLIVGLFFALSVPVKPSVGFDTCTFIGGKKKWAVSGAGGFRFARRRTRGELAC